VTLGAPEECEETEEVIVSVLPFSTLLRQKWSKGDATMFPLLHLPD
jgi:hypothetical protein